MFANTASKAATFLFTVVLSATCIIGAVGPATTIGQGVASSARIMA